MEQVNSTESDTRPDWRLDEVLALFDRPLNDLLFEAQSVHCGGIVGMGESRRDRAGLLVQLANLPEHPESVPINHLVQVAGTPLDGTEPLPPLELVRCIAVARILMPRSVVRLSAGRTELSEEAQALCFLAGAGSIFCGDQLLTTPNPSFDTDMEMLGDLGLERQPIPRRSAEEARP